MRIPNIKEMTTEQKNQLEESIKKSNRIVRNATIITIVAIVAVTLLSVFLSNDTTINTNANTNTNEMNKLNEYIVGALFLGGMVGFVLLIGTIQNYRIKKRRFNTEEITYYQKIFNQLLATFNANRIITLTAGNMDALKDPNHLHNFNAMINQVPEQFNQALEDLPKEFRKLAPHMNKLVKHTKFSYKLNSIAPIIILSVILGAFALFFYYFVSIGEMPLKTAIYTMGAIIGFVLLIVILVLFEKEESKYIDNIVLKGNVIEIKLLNKQLQTDITSNPITYNLNEIDIKYGITRRSEEHLNRHSPFYYFHNIYIMTNNKKVRYELLPVYSYENQPIATESHLFFNEDLKSFITFINLVKQNNISNLSSEQLEESIKDSCAYKDISPFRRIY